jgi:hypothetical protein
MGIRFYCPKGHKLNVKDFQAGRKGICPYCGARIQIPSESTRESSKKKGGGPKPEESGPAVGPSGEAGEGAGDFALGPGMHLPPERPGAEPAAADSPAAIAAETPTMDFASQGPAIGAPVGSAAAGAAPLPSPAIAPQSASITPAGPSPAAPAAPSAAQPEPSAAQPEPSSSSGSPAAADPVAEAGDVVWYVRPDSGGQFGPASGEVMRSWLNQGRVGVDSLVWREGWPDWQQATKVFPQLGAGRPDSGVGRIASADVSTSSATAARSRRAKSVRQSKKTQTLAVILLVFTLIVLFGVLLWILIP